MTVTKEMIEIVAKAIAEAALDEGDGLYDWYALVDDVADAYRRMAEAALTAALSAQPAVAVPDGWKLVPVEPTAEMVTAARLDHEGEAFLPYSLWASMLTAAPQSAPPADLREENERLKRAYQGAQDNYQEAVEECARLHTELEQVRAWVDPSVPEMTSYKDRATAAEARVKALEKQIAKGCEWFWPANDTSSDMCADGVWGVRDNVDLQPGEILHYATGGVLNYGYYAFLEAAEDADSDDEFEVDAPTEEEARAAIDAELARRAALKAGAA